jgi:hypothetical protein
MRVVQREKRENLHLILPLMAQKVLLVIRENRVQLVLQE